MDLLKHYGRKELARMTFNDIKYRKVRKERDIDNYMFDMQRKRYERMHDNKLKQKIV